MKKEPKFKVDQNIIVLSGGYPPLITIVKRIEEEKNDYKYYFDDENGKEWYETEIAIIGGQIKENIDYRYEPQIAKQGFYFIDENGENHFISL